MGYTRYALEINTGDEKTKPATKCETCGHVLTRAFVPLEAILDECVSADYELYVRNLYDGDTSEMKWYDHDKDMKVLSKKFPFATFTLRGEGEEAGDIWVKYYKNGKVQEELAEIKLPSFDESKLK